MSVNLILDEDWIIDAICNTKGASVGYIVGCLVGYLTDDALMDLIRDFHEELELRQGDSVA